MPVADAEESRKLVEGVDYYMENGLWVFTAVFHLKRGYCCKNGCRHCPYGEKGAIKQTQERGMKSE